MKFVENSDFTIELEHLLNKHGIDNECNTPDYILAEYIANTLDLFKDTKEQNENWHSKKMEIDFVEDLKAIKITRANYERLESENKIEDGRIYIIVENPEEENYVEL